MPGFDGTGPRGLGPMTGGGRGFCNPQFRGMRSPYMDSPQAMPYGGNPYGVPPFAPYQAFPYRPFGYGRGFSRGFGMGRGRGRGW
ncbi:MAG: DUF5320 domain-containing protein [Thermodesulfobacteriota bacterium]|nr:DUF5320 domain-containing protein [Thermodesulfobacteriota bacterium]